MRKLLFFGALIIMVVSLGSCGGGSGGSSSSPPGVNPGVVSKVQLLAVQYVAQTNSSITLKAKVLDGNGRPLPDVTVIFTNLSSPFGALSATSVATDKLGFATANLWSGAEGFATVQVDASGGGAGNVRDIATVFFTASNSLNLSPFLILEVDGDGDGIFNEIGDFIALQGSGDQEILVRATVFDGIGLPVFGSAVTFMTDAPYRVGADPNAICSDTSSTCEVSFPSGNVITTNGSGEATVFMKLTPAALRNLQRTLNVLALADNGAFNVLSLFLDPVTISSIVVSTDKDTVASGGTATISAAVITNLGTPAPEGTIVNFEIVSGGGGIVPFGKTDELGLATADFTAPTGPATVVIDASAGGVPSAAPVTVTVSGGAPTAMSITPSSVAVTGVNNPAPGDCPPDADPSDDATFLISGGTPPYSVFSSSNLTVVPLCAATISGNTLTVDPDNVGALATAIITVTDSSATTQTATATVTVNP